MIKKQVSNRRTFLKNCSRSGLPLLLPAMGLREMDWTAYSKGNTDESLPLINFVYDGLGLSPQQYLDKLNEINQTQPIQPDFYGNGGATSALEATFANITGKEKAIYLPSGTMANQLAIKLLNGNRTKVIVPENSHIFRDEADAAQRVHQKRLIPIGKGKAFFDLKELQATIHYLDQGEVFKSGLGTVALENPIRRADGRAIPIETIKAISAYCRQQGYKLHLDGARIHLASAFTGVSISEYASYFDTVYISLYKYLNATGGAILCGHAELIDQVANQIKVYGGTVFQSWSHTAVAQHYLDGIQERWAEVVQRAQQLIKALNQIEGLTVRALDHGTNIYHLQLSEAINLKTLANVLRQEHQIWLGRADEKGIVRLSINESLRSRPLSALIDAWKKGVALAKQ